MDIFNLSLKTKIISQVNTEPVRRAVAMFTRDMAKALPEDGVENTIILAYDTSLGEEDYVVRFNQDNLTMNIYASGNLGFIYALLYISETWMYIDPFWFWMDQTIERREEVFIPAQDYYSLPAKVKYRGWFINDEVLISAWDIDGDSEKPWEMAFEALLRCGGNMVIPGTDANSRKRRKLASDMGLWISHHHAEPLGAEMFARAYPDKEASYDKYPEFFRGLWQTAIDEQKDSNVVWNLGFRGQGDRPFWADDPSYDTPEKRGELISKLINEQYEMVASKVKNPVCCTNLYGEITELYRDGYIHFNDNIIKVWADNGFGKMVSRRRGNINPRTPALPDKPEGRHGIYYHVSFYDLQAANHITMFPNSVDFVNDELTNAFESGVKDYLIVNASNIRPHAYFLDAVRRIWFGEEVSGEEHSEKFCGKYFDYIDGVSWCYDEYTDSMISYGEHEDEHCGEQFYAYSVRNMAAQWMRNVNSPSAAMRWLCGEDADFAGQIEKLYDICEAGREGIEKAYNRCADMDKDIFEGKKQLFDATIFLHTKIHYYGMKALIDFCEAYRAYSEKRYMRAFYLLGTAADKFELINNEMRASEYGVWKGYYANDCLADMKFSAYIIRCLMSRVRADGDGNGYFAWQRNVSYNENDRKVVLITNWENHMTDEEIYEHMKIKTDSLWRE